MEMANPIDWSFDVHLIEIDDVYTDVVYSNIELNRIVLKAKQDTRAQINVVSKTVFQTLQKKNQDIHSVPLNSNSLVSNYRLFRRPPSAPKITPLTQC